MVYGSRREEGKEKVVEGGFLRYFYYFVLRMYSTKYLTVWGPDEARYRR